MWRSDYEDYDEISPIAVVLRNYTNPLWKDRSSRLDHMGKEGFLALRRFERESYHPPHDQNKRYDFSITFMSSKLPIPKGGLLESLVPIEMSMELAVPYSLLLQLKHSYKCQILRSRIGNLLGLNGKEHQTFKVDNQHMLLHPICSKQYDHNSSHPLWNHIDESIDDLRNELSELTTPNSTGDDGAIQRDRIWKEVCDALTIQCKIRMTKPMKTKNTSFETRILASAPINPRLLRKLPKSEISPVLGLLGVSKQMFTMPPALPRNSILVYYSDGTTRVHPDLYNTLIFKKMIQDRIPNEIYEFNEHYIKVDKFVKRFDDTTFDILGDSSRSSVKSFSGKFQVKSCLENTTHSTLSALRTELLPTELISSQNINVIARQNPHTTCKRIIYGSFADAFDSVASTSSDFNYNDASLMSSKAKSERDGKKICEPIRHEDYTELSESCNTVSIITETNRDLEEKSTIFLMKNFDFEIVNLHHILAEEEEILQQEVILLEKNIDSLMTSQQNLVNVRKVIQEIDAEILVTKDEESEFGRAIDFKRYNLLKELQDLYPIRKMPDDIFTIRGVCLPNDMHSLSASDEDISSGLGFVCHVVTMCSKYLSVPLRYRLICNSSRSAVREDNFDVFPLFKERVVEKDQFDRGLVLLHRNIDHLLLSQGTSASIIYKRGHILSKLYLLFE